jgi:hypothetical protein
MRIDTASAHLEAPMTRTRLLLFVPMLALAACGDSRAPTSPSEPPPESPQIARLLEFHEEPTGFSTTDLRDAQDQIVQFNDAHELVWTTDGTRLPGYRVMAVPGYPRGPVYFIDGKICAEGCQFEVRFGSKDGERRASLTVDYGHDNPGTLVDVEIAGGTLAVTRTPLFPPGTYALSGMVTEDTSKGVVPVGGAVVYRGVTSGWQEATTDASGFYRILGLNDGAQTVSVIKPGFQTSEDLVTVSGDTTFNIRLRRP